ncbi:hypothetical protein MRB53_041765 [Persea americana]|nr:hypothetical protein MRB53_041765 [Persea americana]
MLLLLYLLALASTGDAARPTRFQFGPENLTTAINEATVHLQVPRECTNQDTEFCCDFMLRPVVYDVLNSIVGVLDHSYTLIIESVAFVVRDVTVPDATTSTSRRSATGPDREISFWCRIILDFRPDSSALVGFDGDPNAPNLRNDNDGFFIIMQANEPRWMRCRAPYNRPTFTYITRPVTLVRDAVGGCDLQTFERPISRLSVEGPQTTCLEDAAGDDNLLGVFRLEDVN